MLSGKLSGARRRRVVNNGRKARHRLLHEPTRPAQASAHSQILSIYTQVPGRIGRGIWRALCDTIYAREGWHGLYPELGPNVVGNASI